MRGRFREKERGLEGSVLIRRRVWRLMCETGDDHG